MRDAKVERIDVRAYQIPTDYPEANGTLAWDSTTMVLVIGGAGGECGLGYSHTDHVRDGAQAPQYRRLSPDLSRPGLGVELRQAEAERYAL